MSTAIAHSPPLTAHALAVLIPPMSQREFCALVEDIRERGQLDPIHIYEGQVLDGRHRYRACRELGIEPLTVEWHGDDPAHFVISKNLQRRNLTTGQKAVAALALLDYEKARAKERQREAIQERDDRGRAVSTTSAESSQSGVPEHRRATAEAGKKFGISRHSVENARMLANLKPDLLEKVNSGEMSLNAAVEAHWGRTTDRRDNPKQANSPYGTSPIKREMTERQRQISAAERRRISGVLVHIAGLCDGLSNAEVPKAAPDSETTDHWIESTNHALSVLRNLKRDLEAYCREA